MYIRKVVKKSFVSLFFTVIVISMLFFSGPVKAIDISLITPDIDVSRDTTKEFILQVTINDGEFLPIDRTELEFDDGENQYLCEIDEENQIVEDENCNFLSVVSVTVDENLDYRQDYGYGYGYNSGYGYGYGYQDFGYGYGYGYGERGVVDGIGYGRITYTLLVNVTELPESFTEDLVNTIDVIATVYGAGNSAYFVGTSSFDVTRQITDLEAVTVASTALIFERIRGDNTNDNEITALAINFFLTINYFL